MAWIKSMKICHLRPAPGSASLQGFSLTAFSLHWISSSHTLMCSAFILVAPVARPFHSPPNTFHSSESVGMSLVILKCRKLNGRASPMGEALAYSSTCSAVCLTMVSGHSVGGQSSTDLYHPLRACQASFTAPLLKWLLMVEVAFAAHCLRSAVSRDFISCPIRRAMAVIRCPFLHIVAHLSTAAQVLSDIQWLAGRSLAGGVTSRCNSSYLLMSSVRVPGGLRGENGDLSVNTSPSPSLLLCKFWQQ